MQETLEFNIKGNSYTLKFPNVGDFRKIESLKQVLSNGMYSQLVGTMTKQSQHAADIVDIEAMFTVLAPEMIEKELESRSFGSLGMKDFQELHTAYMEQVIPWWNDNLKAIGLRDE